MKSNASTVETNDYQYKTLIQEIKNEKNTVKACKKIYALINDYNEQLNILEPKLLGHELINEAKLESYQNRFRELEAIHALLPADRRHSFYITIPVADRPTHLKQCLNSLLRLCQLYQYGGYTNNKFNKIHVIIADDSKHKNNINQHYDIVNFFNKKGLNIEYFGLQEQIHLIKKMDKKQRQQLQRILGNYQSPLNIKNFSHKGASITRNIAYLRLNEIHLNRTEENKLFYFIDSDQKFCINQNNGSQHYAINYFHHLNEIFTNTQTEILTGKVVGDPPVSPAVMASKFQDDVLNFINTIEKLNPENNCQFHNKQYKNNSDASYHDMPNLFGFKDEQSAINYQCNLHGPHSNAKCLENFASRLNSFFYGEHPTRESYFQYDNALIETLPARTIYTGNYIFKPKNLKYFISFASLNLRMAGPVLGRILKTEIGDHFVSANLPMLHTRTVNKTGESEFRTGVKSSSSIVDLSLEFEKQYYGDILLFTIEKLLKHGFPEKETGTHIILKFLQQTDNYIQTQYTEKHHNILDKANKLKTKIHTGNGFFTSPLNDQNILDNFERFIKNIVYNFDDQSAGYHLIRSKKHKNNRLNAIANAIVNYKSDSNIWLAAIKD